MIFGEREKIRDASRYGFFVQRVGSRKKTGNDSDALKNVDPMFDDKLSYPIEDNYTARRARRESALTVRNICFRPHQCLSRNLHDPLVHPATRAEREALSCARGDINADDGEITGFQFENIRATAERRRARAVRMRIRAEATLEHARSTNYS